MQKRSQLQSLRIQSRYLVTHPEQVLSPAQVVVQSGRIIEVTGDIRQAADIDLGARPLLPGWVNPHTHLEFSHLQQPFPPGDAFPEWIAAVVEHRRQLAATFSPDALLEHRRQSILDGMLEAFTGGTALLADIVTPPWDAGLLPTIDQFIRRATLAKSQAAEVAASSSSERCHRNNDRLISKADRPNVPASIWDRHLRPVAFPRVLPLPEILGLDETALNRSFTWAQRLLETGFVAESGPDKTASKVSHASRETLCDSLGRETLWHVPPSGISPHAPYSTAWPLLGRLVESLTPPKLIAMHVAESRAERQWLDSGGGAFLAAFQRLGVPLEGQRMGISDAIEMLGHASRGLLVHGNYLTQPELAKVAGAGSIHVVHCPRTHRHFGHPAFPFHHLRQRSIPVIIGTDSRASNPDLDLWQELLAVLAGDCGWSPAQALAAITSNAATALGTEQHFGTLEPGRLAYLTVSPQEVEVPAAELLEHLMSPEKSSISPYPLAYWIERQPATVSTD